MSTRRFHPALLEDAARDLDRRLRALSTGEARREPYLKNHQAHLDYLKARVDAGVAIQGTFTLIKRGFRKFLRAYLFHQASIDNMMIERLADLTDEIGQLRSALDGLRDEVREDLDDQEIRLQRRSSIAPRPRIPATRSLPDGARLLLGEVPLPGPGYLTVKPEGDDADLTSPLDQIPARPGTAAEIIAANVLEHYPIAEVRDRLLPHWAGLLRPGGTLTLIADDFEAAADRHRDGSIDTESLVDALFGDGGRPRRSAFTPETLRQFVAEAGFVGVHVTERLQSPNAGAYAFAISATAPAA